MVKITLGFLARTPCGRRRTAGGERLRLGVRTLRVHNRARPMHHARGACCSTLCSLLTHAEHEGAPQLNGTMMLELARHDSMHGRTAMMGPHRLTHSATSAGLYSALFLSFFDSKQPPGRRGGGSGVEVGQVKALRSVERARQPRQAVAPVC